MIPKIQRSKNIESRYMKEARLASSIFPEGMLVAHERPDFLLRTNKETIGIEITELCREEERGEGGRLEKIPTRAIICYNQLENAKPVNVVVGFSRLAKDIKSKELINSLVEFVYKNQSKEERFTRDLPRGYLHIGIRAPFDLAERWCEVRSFNTVVASKELLESRIAEKNRRVQNYRNSTPEVSQIWLLIVNDLFLGPGEVYANPVHLAEWEFVFDFEKVLLFSRVPGDGSEVIPLRRT